MRGIGGSEDSESASVRARDSGSVVARPRDGVDRGKKNERKHARVREREGGGRRKTTISL